MNIKQKKTYIPPILTVVTLDNDISLALESAPPVPGNESLLHSADYINSDPFKIHRV